MLKMTGTIGLIGAGNMAHALIQGLLAHDTIPSQLFLYDHHLEKSATLAKIYGIQSVMQLSDLIEQSNTVIFTVKPASLEQLCKAIQMTSFTYPSLWISVAAGVCTTTIENFLQKKIALVRAMPNISVACGVGATGLYANEQVSIAQKALSTTLFNAVGITLWVDNENTLDTVTAVSGSGPAYFFYFLEALLQGALSLGLSEEVARALILQTAQGAITLATTTVDWSHLRRQVTSHGGTTAAAIAVLKNGNFQTLIENALHAAKQRA